VFSFQSLDCSRTNPRVVVFGDSGNFSPEFNITSHDPLSLEPQEDPTQTPTQTTTQTPTQTPTQPSVNGQAKSDWREAWISVLLGGFLFWV
jgi:hypothetical protein